MCSRLTGLLCTVLHQSYILSAKVSTDSVVGFEVYCSLCLQCLCLFYIYSLSSQTAHFSLLERCKLVFIFFYSVQQSMAYKFFQHRKCGECTHFKLFNITHKLGHAYSAMILKREVRNQTMSSCNKPN